MEFYPLKFQPIYKEVVWGGSALRSLFGRAIPSDKTGETWDISCREQEMGICANGAYAGQTFAEILAKNPIAFLGENVNLEEAFPLLVKLIDANDNLSIQVHPDDTYAREKEGYIYGKSEMWYILDAPKDAKMIIGLRDGVTRENFLHAIESGTVMDTFHELPVKKGDVINIKAGLLHAITKGIVLAEIQQNSDITYRAYDYDRLGLDGKPRALHTEKAADVLDYDSVLSKEVVSGLTVTELDGNTRTYYISGKYFDIVLDHVVEEKLREPDRSSFETFTCVEGSCVLVGDGFEVPLALGDSVFIPASTPLFRVLGEASLLIASIPSGEEDFLEPLTTAGFSTEEIREHVAFG